MSESTQEKRRGRSRPQAAAAEQGTADQQPDVLLDVPNLKVDEIYLEVDNRLRPSQPARPRGA
jgi:hypothetical protein